MFPPPREPIGPSYALGTQLNDAAREILYFQDGKPVSFYNPQKITIAVDALREQTSDPVFQVAFSHVLEKYGKKCTTVAELDKEKTEFMRLLETHETLPPSERSRLSTLCEILGTTLHYDSSVEPEEHPFKHY